MASVSVLRLELAEILDDAVMDDRDLAVHVRMRVALGGTPVRCPARMSDARVAPQGLLQQATFEVAQLALGTPALQVAVLDGGDAGRVIAAILEPTQRIDEVRGDSLLPDNSDDTAHAFRILALASLPYC